MRNLSGKAYNKHTVVPKKEMMNLQFLTCIKYRVRKFNGGIFFMRILFSLFRYFCITESCCGIIVAQKTLQIC